MDPIISKPESASGPSSGSTEIQALMQRIKKLETLFLVSLGAIILLSIGFNILMSNQIKAVQIRYDEQSPGIKQYAKGFREADEPLMRSFALALQQYAAANRDFLPIWEKYRPALTNLLTPVKLAPPPAKTGARK